MSWLVERVSFLYLCVYDQKLQGGSDLAGRATLPKRWSREGGWDSLSASPSIPSKFYFYVVSKTYRGHLGSFAKSRNLSYPQVISKLPRKNQGMHIWKILLIDPSPEGEPGSKVLLWLQFYHLPPASAWISSELCWKSKTWILSMCCPGDACVSVPVVVFLGGSWIPECTVWRDWGEREAVGWPHGGNRITVESGSLWGVSGMGVCAMKHLVFIFRPCSYVRWPGYSMSQNRSKFSQCSSICLNILVNSLYSLVLVYLCLSFPCLGSVLLHEYRIIVFLFFLFFILTMLIGGGFKTFSTYEDLKSHPRKSKDPA